VRRLHAQVDLSDPYAAASLIGVTHVRRIVINVGMNRFLGDRANSFFFRHSFAVAVTSQELAALCGVSPDEAYIAGILHDVGQLCFHMIDDQAFQDAYLQSAVDGKLIEREAALFGMNHCQIGAKLAQYWNLPEEVLSAIATHHDEATVTSRLQAVVCLGETLSRALDMPASPRNRVLTLNSKAVEFLEIDWSTPDMLDCFGRCRARFQQGARHFASPHD
jgi:putative nucleotidyltransferase with HDIG domain